MRTFAKKIMSGMMAAVLAVGLMPGLAVARGTDVPLTGDDMVEAPTTITNEDGATSKEISTEISLRTVGGLGVQRAQEFIGEEAYSTGQPITAYVTGIGEDSSPQFSWFMAKAIYGTGLNANSIDYEASLAEAQKAGALESFEGDSAAYEPVAEGSSQKAWVVKRVPRNDGLDPNGTYLYWLKAETGSGITHSEVMMATGEPCAVVRESGFGPGPYFNAEGDAWKWAVAGANAEDGSGRLKAEVLDANESDGGIRVGATLSAGDPTAANVMALGQAASAAGMAPSNNKTWNVQINEAGGKTGDAYKNRIMVVLNAQGEAWPADVPGRTPGVNFDVFHINPNDPSKVVALSKSDCGLQYCDGQIIFFVEDTQAGNLGDFTLGIRQTPAEADKAFDVDTAVEEDGEGIEPGTVSGAGHYEFGQQATFYFHPEEGYQVETVKLEIHETKSAGVKETRTIPHQGAEADSGLDASYGTWQGDSYTLPETFNQDGDEAYAVLRVTFGAIPDNDETEPAKQPKLSVTVSGNGTVYVGSDTSAPNAAVHESATFAAGDRIGSFTLEKNKAVPLTITADEGSVIGSVRICGEEYKSLVNLKSGTTSISKLVDENTTVEVEFKYGSGPEPELPYTVTAEYDSSKAQVGFGAEGTGSAVVWKDSQQVAAGGTATLVVKPKPGYALQSATRLYGTATEGTPIGFDEAAAAGTLTLPVTNVTRDTRVKLEFSELAVDVTVEAAPAGGSVLKLGADGSTAPAEGTHQVTVSEPLRVQITSNAGYELDASTLKLVGNSASVDLGIVSSDKQGQTGPTTYVVEVKYADAAAAGAGAKLSYAFKKQEAPAGKPNAVTGTVGAGADGQAHGRVADITTLNAAGDTKVFFFPDEGYRVSYVEVDGKRVTNPDVSDDRFTCDIKSSAPCITFHTASESFVVNVVFEKIPDAGQADSGQNQGAQKPGEVIDTKPQQPGNAQGEQKPGGSIAPSGSAGEAGDVPTYTGPAGGGTTFEYEPDDADADGTEWVVDTIVLDGAEILDEWGFELKDKMQPSGEDGILIDPESGVRYDTAAGEYLFSGPGDKVNRVKVDADKGTVTLVEVYRDLKPAGGFASATRTTVTVEMGMQSETTGGGSITPSGEDFRWKKKLPMTVVMLPDKDKELRSLTAAGEPLGHVQATDEHMDELYNCLTLIERLTKQDAQRAADAASRAAGLSQTVSLQRAAIQQAAAAEDADSTALDEAVRTATGAEPAYAADRIALVDGMRAAVIPGDMFQSDTNRVVVHARFGDPTYTVKARVEGGHGTISGLSSTDSTLTVDDLERGSSYTVNYKADAGYRVKSVTDNGKAVKGFTETSYGIANIAEDHDIVITFESVATGAAAGPNDPASKALRRLTSLASTGDLNLPGMVLMIGIACAAAGTAILAANRRRKSEE